MSANTGINGVLLTNIIKINGVTVAGSSKNVAGAILSFGGASGTTTTTTASSGTTTTTTAGTSGTGGGGGGTPLNCSVTRTASSAAVLRIQLVHVWTVL